MKLHEFIAAADEYVKNNPRYRKGQGYFNYLNSVRPDLAVIIVGSDNDPFYDDSKIPAMLVYIEDEL